MTEEKQPHTQLTTAIGTDSAVIVGDPARVDRDWRPIGRDRGRGAA